MPPNATWVEQREGILRLVGNFSLHVWDTSVTVRNATESQTFTSGNWTEPVGPSQPYVRKRYDQIIRLDLKDASFELVSQGREILFATPYVSLDGNLTASFAGVKGTIRQGATQSPLESTTLKLSGPLSLRTWNPKGNGTILQNELTTSAASLGLAPEAPVQAPEASLARPNAAAAWPIAIIMIPASIASLGVFLVVARRSRPPTIDDVEWALFEKKAGKAAKLGRRLVKRTPRDATAVFLLGTALLAQDQPQQLLDAIEPMARHLQRKHRAGVAYVLARAAHSLADLERADVWAREAARQPALRSQLARDGILASNVQTPVQSGYA